MTARPVQETSPLTRVLPAGGRAATALAGWEVGKAGFLAARNRWREATRRTLTIEEGDPVYADVHRWLLELTGGHDHRDLTVTTSRHSGGEMPDDGRREPASPVTLRFNDRRERAVQVDGHRVLVQVKRLEEVEVSKSGGEFTLVPRGIVFTCRSAEALRAVVRHVERLHTARTARRPRLMIVNQWGHWTSRDDLPGRPLESVILPGNQRERVADDLSDFLEAEPDYARLAVPWHRGYLLHGPPGTGKTSLVRALADAFSLDLWYCPLGDLSKEASLINLLAEVSPRSIVLLEDVDTVALTHDREEQAPAAGKSVSLSGLLNALDGVATPHGLITVMTTNHFDRLDPALTRAGRMDVVEELSPPGWPEVARLFRRFYGTETGVVDWPDGPCPLTQAEASEVFKTHMRDPQGALQQIKEATT